MTIVIYDYKEYNNDVIHKEVHSIEQVDALHLALHFENGEYLTFSNNDYNYIKIM